MKKIAILPLFLLTSCASNLGDFINNADEFVTAAGYEDVAVYSSTTTLSGTVSGLSAHSASLYQDGAFTVSTSSYAYTGFELVTNNVTQYVLIDSTASSRSVAYIYDSDDELLDKREQASELLEEDYKRVLAVYETFKTYVGVYSNGSWDSISLTKAEAGDVVGYTLIQSLSGDSYYHEIEQYVTFNNIDGKYAIVDYSYRETTTSGTSSTYAIAETTFSISETLPTISTSLASAYYVVMGEESTSTIPGTNALTPKES